MKEVKRYEEALKDLERVRRNGLSSFMDVSVRMERVETAKKKAIKALGTKELERLREKL